MLTECKFFVCLSGTFTGSYYEKFNIYFLDFVKNVDYYMKNVDYLCMTSKYEGMPITLLESMANGLVPLVTPSEGITDIIKDNINGLVSKKISVESYVKVLENAMKINPKDKEKISKNCVDIFKTKYTMDICENNYFFEYVK